MAIYHLHVSTGSKSAGASASIRHDYLAREGDYQTRSNELVYSASENMPSWALNAREFWSAADAHERANGRLYQEIEFALPKELDSAGQIELAKDFAHDLTYEHKLPYTLAIHSDGNNPHAHLIYSERADDGFERSKELHFKRANSSSPELGGAPKVTSLRGSEWVKQVRKDWEICANAALERSKSIQRIDCRSYEERGIEQTPQIHLGVRAAAMMRQGIDTERSAEWERRQEIRSIERELYDLESVRIDVEYERYRTDDPVQDAIDQDAKLYEAQLERERLALEAQQQQLEQERKQFEHDMQEELRQEQAELDLELERQRAYEKLRAQQLEHQKAQQVERSNSPPERLQPAQPPSPLTQTIREHMEQGGRIEELAPGVSVTGVRLEGTFYSPSKQQSYALIQDEKDPKRMVAVRADEPELTKSRCAEGRRMRISCLTNNVGKVCITSMRKDQERDRSWGR